MCQIANGEMSADEHELSMQQVAKQALQGEDTLQPYFVIKFTGELPTELGKLADGQMMTRLLNAVRICFDLCTMLSPSYCLTDG